MSFEPTVPRYFKLGIAMHFGVKQSSQTGEIKCSFPGVICPRWHSSDVAPPRDITWPPWRTFTSGAHLTASRRPKSLREAKNDCETSSAGTTIDFSLRRKGGILVFLSPFYDYCSTDDGDDGCCCEPGEAFKDLFFAFPNGRLLEASLVLHLNVETVTDWLLQKLDTVFRFEMDAVICLVSVKVF